MQQALRDNALTTRVQKPGVQRRPADHIEMGACGMRTKSQSAPVLAALNVGSYQGDFSVGGMKDERRTIKRFECCRNVEPGQGALSGGKQFRPFSKSIRCYGAGIIQ